MLVKSLKNKLLLGLLSSLFMLSGCGEENNKPWDKPWNDPYPDDQIGLQTLYTSFSEQPKHLDPATSYSSNEWVITNQIYESPLQYHYLKRPYTLEPLLATQIPTVTYLDQYGKSLNPDNNPNQFSKAVVYTLYDIYIKPGTYYQPHPAFAMNKKGEYEYHDLLNKAENILEDIYTLQDFPHTGTRELTADDFVYQVKRLGDPTLSSPIFGLMQNYIFGLDAFEQTIRKHYEKKGDLLNQPKYIDLNQYNLSGAQVISRYHYQIKIIGHYPQFIYWLAMPFFAPMPWEAARFYSQVPLYDKNISLDWYPIGTGPFMLSENNPNQRMILTRNPNYHGERYPSQGEAGDVAKGLLKLKNQPLPFLDKIVFSLETESIPYWNKFLQGYYDQSGISSDSFDQALQSVSNNAGLELTQSLKSKKIQLESSILPSVFYWGFNMIDDTVGGYTDKKRKLRQAISIAMDMEEYIAIFANGRGVAAQSPIPEGIFGFLEGMPGINPIVYTVDPNTQKIKRKSIAIAQQLLSEAGYPNGIDPKTHQPLTLYLDATMGGGPDSNAMYAWIRKQFKKLNIELVIRATQYNRFQEKMRTGNAQIFSWGWNADYPDPENFLFLLYGPNGKVKQGGENAVNYLNSEYDQLFEQMKSLPDGAQRQTVINKMIDILRTDSPWIWGYNPMLYALSHQWFGPEKPSAMSRNTIKYIQIDAPLRAKLQKEWNQPIVWPLGLFGLGFLILCIPAVMKYRQKIHHKFTFTPIIKAKKEKKTEDGGESC